MSYFLESYEDKTYKTSNILEDYSGMNETLFNAEIAWNNIMESAMINEYKAIKNEDVSLYEENQESFFEKVKQWFKDLFASISRVVNNIKNTIILKLVNYSKWAQKIKKDLKTNTNKDFEFYCDYDEVTKSIESAIKVLTSVLDDKNTHDPEVLALSSGNYDDSDDSDDTRSLSSGRNTDALSSGRNTDALSSGRNTDALPSGRNTDALPSGRNTDALPSKASSTVDKERNQENRIKRNQERNAKKDIYNGVLIARDKAKKRKNKKEKEKRKNESAEFLYYYLEDMKEEYKNKRKAAETIYKDAIKKIKTKKKTTYNTTNDNDIVKECLDYLNGTYKEKIDKVLKGFNEAKDSCKKGISAADKKEEKEKIKGYKMMSSYLNLLSSRYFNLAMKDVSLKVSFVKKYIAASK